MKRPEDVNLSREEGEALLVRLEANALTAEDRRVLGKVLTFYFWLLFALREAKLSLKRVKALVFGEKPQKPKPPSPGGAAGGGNAGGSETQTRESQRSAFLRFSIAVRGEATPAWTWTAGSSRVSGGADGRVSP